MAGSRSRAAALRGPIMAPNLINPGQDDRKIAHRLERARDLVVDVVEGVRDEHARRQGSVLPAGAEVEHPAGYAGICAEHRLELDPLDSAGIAELGPDRESAPLIIG